MRHARLHPRQGLWQRGLFPTQRAAQCTLGTGPAVFSPVLPSLQVGNLNDSSIATCTASRRWHRQLQAPSHLSQHRLLVRPCCSKLPGGLLHPEQASSPPPRAPSTPPTCSTLPAAVLRRPLCGLPRFVARLHFGFPKTFFPRSMSVCKAFACLAVTRAPHDWTYG